MEEFPEDVGVYDFDADISVETCGDEAGNQGKDVGDSDPVVGIDTLVSWIVRVLALVAIDEGTEEDVAAKDEEVGTNQTFPEVPSG